MDEHAASKRSHSEAIDENNEDTSLFVEDDTDRVPAYDATKEPLPDCKVNTSEYCIIADGKDKISNLVESPFSESPFRSGPTDGLLEDLKKRVKDRSSDKIKVGVVGDMSSGKSSVINSLLSVGVIARQGDAGASCTWVVNEFSSVLPNQTKSFAVDIYFFGPSERHDIVKALVGDYFRAKDHDTSDGSKDPDQASDDLSTMQGVVAAFRSLFPTSAEFETVEKAHEYLSQATSEDDEEMIDTLCCMSDNLMAAILKGHCIRAEADTPQSLLLDIEPFQHTVEEHEGGLLMSPWPFVSRIRFGLECELLKHITLLDLPGLSDANKTRVANAITHLRTCTHYMIVAHIGRATDDKFIRQHLSRGFQSRGSGRCTLVLTRADTMDESSDVVMTRKGQQMIDGFKAKIEELDKRKLELTHKIKKLQKGMQKYEAIEAKDAVAAEIRKTEAMIQEVRIKARSLNVSRQMATLYSDLTPDPVQLPVFCVGNAAYKKHQVGYALDDPSPPTLSVQGTNIPLLRQHLLRAPMEGQLNEMRNQVVRQIPAILSSCELYASKTHMARKDEIARIVTDPQLYYHSIVDSAFAMLKQDADRFVLSAIRSDELNWTADAQKLCDIWAKTYPTAAHFAMLKKDGTRKATKRVKAANWNAELVAINAAEVGQWFANFIPSIEVAQKQLVKEINQLATKMSEQIKSDPQVALMALKPFLDHIWTEKGTINIRADRPFRKLRREIGNLVRCATTDENDNAIVSAMRSVYEQARKIKNQKGVKGPAHKRRLETFNEAVSRQGEGVWMAAHDILKSGIDTLLDAYADQLKNVMAKFFGDIEKAFELTCAEKGEEDEREVELRAHLTKNTAEARDFYENELLPEAQKFFAK